MSLAGCRERPEEKGTQIQAAPLCYAAGEGEAIDTGRNLHLIKTHAAR
jgi:hypothetical protein